MVIEEGSTIHRAVLCRVLHKPARTRARRQNICYGRRIYRQVMLDGIGAFFAPKVSDAAAGRAPHKEVTGYEILQSRGVFQGSRRFLYRLSERRFAPPKRSSRNSAEPHRVGHRLHLSDHAAIRARRHTMGYGLGPASASRSMTGEAAVITSSETRFWHHGLTSSSATRGHKNDGVIVSSTISIGGDWRPGHIVSREQPLEVDEAPDHRGGEGYGRGWVRHHRPQYDVGKMQATLVRRDTEERAEVIIASSECMLNRQAARSRCRKAIRRRTIVKPKFGVDEDICTRPAHAVVGAVAVGEVLAIARDDPVAPIDERCRLRQSARGAMRRAGPSFTRRCEIRADGTVLENTAARDG